MCKRCGMELSEKSIHLMRNWKGRKEAVLEVYPDADVSFCSNPPPESFFEEEVKIRELVE